MHKDYPDKLCNQVSDTVQDACQKGDPMSKATDEAAIKDNVVTVADEVTTKTMINYESDVHDVVTYVSFDSYIDGCSNVDSKGLSDKTCKALARFTQQSLDTAGGVHVDMEDLMFSAGNLGITSRHATDETEDCLPFTRSAATQLGGQLT